MMKISMTVAVMPAILFFSVSASAQDNFASSMERGKKVYEATCLPCHQANGSGVPNLNPPLKQTKWVLGDKPTLIRVLLNGMDEEIEIDGAYFENTMPAQSALNDEQIADVLTYVRNSFGNKAAAITPAEVKKVRAK
jgi:mono/diheme cytochrome c family protein